MKHRLERVQMLVTLMSLDVMHTHTSQRMKEARWIFKQKEAFSLDMEKEGIDCMTKKNKEFFIYIKDVFLN